MEDSRVEISVKLLRDRLKHARLAGLREAAEIAADVRRGSRNSWGVHIGASTVEAAIRARISELEKGE